MPDCSIIMPAHNADQTLKRAVTSILDQDFQSWELIIVDDASRDQTAQIASRLSAIDPRIIVLTQDTRSGAAKARNIGLKHAQGRFIAFLDADDEWLPHKLTQQIAFMKSKGAAFSFTQFVRHQGATTYTVQVPQTVTYAQLLKGNVIGCLTAMYDTTLLPKTPMPEIRLRHDYALWLALLKQVDHAYGLQITCARHHRQKESLSSGLWNGAHGTWRMLRGTQDLSRTTTLWYLLNHYINRLRAHRSEYY